METNVGLEILKQLGGSKFIAMTGSKNFLYSTKENNFLTMHLTKNKIGAKYLKIKLTSLDDYTLTFSKEKKTFETIGSRKFVKSTEVVELLVIERINDDQLQKTFTEVTGLDTHL